MIAFQAQAQILSHYEKKNTDPEKAKYNGHVFNVLIQVSEDRSDSTRITIPFDQKDIIEELKPYSGQMARCTLTGSLRMWDGNFMIDAITKVGPAASESGSSRRAA